jgi:hypothetical protein
LLGGLGKRKEKEKKKKEKKRSPRAVWRGTDRVLADRNKRMNKK